MHDPAFIVKSRMQNRKVVVFGKGEAGKSTFINTIIPDAINVEHKGRTVAMDFGRAVVGDKTFHFYGTPGQARFEPIREILSASAHCALMIFDSASGVDMEDRAILEQMTSLKVPFFAVLNKKEGTQEKTVQAEIEGICRAYSGFQGVSSGDVRNSGFARSVLGRIQNL